MAFVGHKTILTFQILMIKRISIDFTKLAKIGFSCRSSLDSLLFFTNWWLALTSYVILDGFIKEFFRPNHIKVTTMRWVQSFLKIYLKESKFYLDRSIFEVFLLGSAQISTNVTHENPKNLTSKVDKVGCDSAESAIICRVAWKWTPKIL